MILDLARLWGQAPGWFYTLERADQIRLLAWHRVYSGPAPEASSGQADQPTVKRGQAKRGKGAVKGRR